MTTFLVKSDRKPQRAAAIQTSWTRARFALAAAALHIDQRASATIRWPQLRTAYATGHGDPLSLSIRHLIVDSVLFLSLTSAGAAQEDHAEAGNWSCYTEYGQGTIYTTPVWEATAFMGEVDNGFAQLLFTEYGYKGQVFCGRADLGGATVSELVTDHKRRNAQWTGQGKNVIETAFTFDPATASLAFACQGFTEFRAGTQTVDSVFLSPVIRIPGSSQAGLEAAWNAYLQKSHHGSPVYIGGCTLLAADPGRRQAQIESLPTTFRTTHPAILHVDWTYTVRP